MPTVRILGLDPGTNSFAYSVLELTTKTEKASVKILQRGFIKSTVFDLRSPKYLRVQIAAFKSCVNSLIETNEVKFVVAERYQSRGMGGATIEHVNIMLGCLLSRFDVKTRIFPASQWKNDLNRKGFVLNDVYEAYKKIITPHEIDAGHIGWYGANALSKGLLSHVGILESIIATEQQDVVADIPGYGEIDTVEIKKGLSKEKRNKRKKRKK